jgi:DNA-binding CsgD family transcriptional regulator
MCDEWWCGLSRAERALLKRLADGATLVAAAAAEFLSIRTANRRMAQLRLRAGVKTTRELLQRYKEFTCPLLAEHDELHAPVDCPVLS